MKSVARHVKDFKLCPHSNREETLKLSVEEHARARACARTGRCGKAGDRCGGSAEVHVKWTSFLDQEGERRHNSWGNKWKATFIHYKVIQIHLHLFQRAQGGPSRVCSKGMPGSNIIF